MTGKEQKILSAFEPGIWTIGETDYVELVNKAMRERGSWSLKNDGPFHAAHLIREFFLGAKKEMRIFSGKLRRCGDHAKDSQKIKVKVYEDEHILSAVGDFLAKKGARLRIVVEDGLDGGTEGHPLVKKLNALKAEGRLRGSCEIAKLHIEEKPAANEAEKENPAGRHHMIVMDQLAYRLETDHDEAKALVNLNDKFMAGLLIHVFDESLWNEKKQQLLWSNASAAK